MPVWVIQSALPIGFGLVAARLLYYAGETWKLRALAAALTGLLMLLVMRLPVPPAEAVTPALIGLLAATALGSPVFATLGGAALILFWGADLPIASIPLDHYRLVINPSLPTIPLFTLAGYFLAEGGASQRLVRVFQALFGQFRGGPAIVTALVCAFFTSFTGASGVTILALGGLADAHIAYRRLSTQIGAGPADRGGFLGFAVSSLLAAHSCMRSSPKSVSRTCSSAVLCRAS